MAVAMSVDPERVKDLFSQAAEFPSAADAELYLKGACAGDAALEREVRSLLSAQRQAGDFLSGAEIGIGRTMSVAPLGPGTEVAGYRIIEMIGEGGVGWVFRAEQQGTLVRAVAVKLIKPGMDTRQVMARFEIERRALAMMQHPHIAQVYDAGATSDGRPFFAMELVEGERITEFCEQSRLNQRERVALLIGVCRAIQHAHDQGVIHRDIKPSNVLVKWQDGKPFAKVIDFGIAKAAGNQWTEQTQQQQFLGTPAYASPEQLRGDSTIDGRTDVYGLGALLRELLTGHTPMETDGGAKELKGNLKRIVCQCLEPSPDGRYATPGALADDLERHLDGKRSLAGRGGFVGRFKTARWVAVAAAILLTGAAFALAIRRSQSSRVVQAPEVRAPRRVDLMPLINPPRDAVSGSWKMEAGELSARGTLASRLEIPYRPPAEYDFEIHFIDSAGDGPVIQICPIGGEQMLWQVAWDGYGFEGAVGLPGAKRPLLKQGVENVGVVRVRKDRVSAFLNDTLIAAFDPRGQRFSLQKSAWSLRSSASLGLGVWNSTTRFKRVELIEISSEVGASGGASR